MTKDCDGSQHAHADALVPVAYEDVDKVYIEGDPELNDHIRATGRKLYGPDAAALIAAKDAEIERLREMLK